MISKWMLAAALPVGLLTLGACGEDSGANGNGTGGNGTGGSNGSGNGTVDMGGGNGTVDMGDGNGTVDMGSGNGAVDMGGGNGTIDMGMEVDMGEEPMCVVPSGNFGTTPGRNFSGFDGVTLCDGTTPFDFFEADSYCDAKLTVLVRAAEWCGPCRSEAAEMGAGELAQYADQVRVLSVMVQDAEGGPPRASDCAQWNTMYNLDNTGLEHYMLMDPAQEIGVYFPPGENAYPGNLVVDDEGVIRNRIIGFSPNLSSLKDVLDSLLGE